MPTSIPPVLAPYLLSSVNKRSISLITTVLETPANWLIPRFIRTAIFGVDDEIVTSHAPLNGYTSGSSPTSVIFLSFVKSYEFWVELSRKIGLDLGALAVKKRFAYVDGLTVGVNILQSVTRTTRPKSLTVDDISHAITVARSTLSSAATLDEKTILIMDGLDLLLAIQPDIDAGHLQSFLTRLQDEFSNIALTLSADSPLLHNIEASTTPIELEHSIFVRTAAHQSEWVLQLRPLETGHAKDVSGVIRITRGGADVSNGEDLMDGEWLYQVKGDGDVKIWSRGD